MTRASRLQLGRAGYDRARGRLDEALTGDDADAITVAAVEVAFWACAVSEVAGRVRDEPFIALGFRWLRNKGTHQLVARTELAGFSFPIRFPAVMGEIWRFVRRSELGAESHRSSREQALEEAYDVGLGGYHITGAVDELTAWLDEVEAAAQSSPDP